MDIFDMFFGGHHSSGPSKGKDMVQQLKVTLEELYNGSLRKLALQKNVICQKCDGKTRGIQVMFFLVLWYWPIN